MEPSPPNALPRARIRLHLLLFLLTVLSLALAGGLIWDPPDIRPEALSTVAGWVEVLVSGVPYAFWVLAILGAHEMGHFLACRRYRIPVTLPFFLPGPPPLGTFGAVLRIRGLIPDRRALFDVAAAGPLAGLAVGLPVLIVGLWTATPQTAAPESAGIALGAPLAWELLARLQPHPVSPEPNALIVAGWVGALFTSLNLFPVGQLDGGHVAFAISRRLHRWLAYGTLAGLLTLVVFQAVVEHEVPAYGVWILILVWMRDRHPPVVDPYVPLGRVRTLIAVLLFVVFLACFIPLPLRIVGG